MKKNDEKTNDVIIGVELKMHRTQKNIIKIGLLIVALIVIGSTLQATKTNIVPYETSTSTTNALPTTSLSPFFKFLKNEKVFPGYSLNNLETQSNSPVTKTTRYSMKSNSDSNGLEPRLIKTPGYSIALSENGEFFAVGPRYDSNSKLHNVLIYQWDANVQEYLLVGKINDTQFGGNVLKLAITDFNYNNAMEIVLASSNGYIYVFEENNATTTTQKMQFELVWKSISVVKAWDFDIADIDSDNFNELIVAGHKQRIHIFGIKRTTNTSGTFDFWENFQERWRSPILKGHALSITAGDLNGNGMTDIVVGFMKGDIVIFEDQGNNTASCSENHHKKSQSDDDNNTMGTSSNGHQKNHDDDDDDDNDDKNNNKNKKSYDLCFSEIWRDENNFWNPIISLKSYDIDLDNLDEVGIIALSQDVMLLEYENNSNQTKNTFILDRVTLLPQPWEQRGAYPLDFYVDTLLEAFNVTFDGNLDMTEPLDWLDPRNAVSPYTSAMENKSLSHYSHMGQNSWAVLDWGYAEEVVGSGNSQADILIHLKTPYNGSLSALEIRFGKEYEDEDDEDDKDDVDDHIEDTENEIAEHWPRLSSDNLQLSEDNKTILIDIDPLLTKRKWDFVRYTYIRLPNNVEMDITYWEASRINLKLDSVRSLMFDTIPMTNEYMRNPVMIVSTSEGNLITFDYVDAASRDSWKPRLVPIANAYQDQSFLLNPDGAWDMIPNPQHQSIPNWINPTQLNVFQGNDLSRIVQLTLGPDLNINNVDNAENDLYVVGDNAEIRLITDPYLTNWEAVKQDSILLFNELTTYYKARNIENIRITAFDLLSTPDPQSHPEIIVSSENAITLDIWYLVPSTKTFELHSSINLDEIDSTGNLTALASNMTEPFEIGNGDFDGDGKIDIILGTGNKLFLLRQVIKNGTTAFEYIPGFFADIENAINRLGYHRFERRLLNFQGYDYDFDGDADLLASLDLRPGFTFFENIGNGLNSSWVEKRNFVHFRPPQTTFTNYDFIYGVFWSGYKKATQTNTTNFFALNNKEQASIWEPSYAGQQSWLVVTSTDVKTILTNYLSNDSFQNWGYQYIEQWSLPLTAEKRSEHDDVDNDDDMDDNHTKDKCEEKIHLLPLITVHSGDSDGDDIMDGLEGFSHQKSLKTAIDNPDTDGDGLSDLFELKVGLNPRDGDTDHDLIPDGIEFMKHYYDDDCDDNHHDDDDDCNDKDSTVDDSHNTDDDDEDSDYKSNSNDNSNNTTNGNEQNNSSNNNSNNTNTKNKNSENKNHKKNTNTKNDQRKQHPSTENKDTSQEKYNVIPNISNTEEKTTETKKTDIYSINTNEILHSRILMEQHTINDNSNNAINEPIVAAKIKITNESIALRRILPNEFPILLNVLTRD